MEPTKTATVDSVNDKVSPDEGDGSHSIAMPGEVLLTEEDLFMPFPIDETLESLEAGRRILRTRSVFVGVLLGGIVNAANVYLGLRMGITFPANLFGAIVGFAVVKSLSKAFSESIPILGGAFGPKENAIIQTSATAAGGLSTVFTSAIPALYQMDLLHTPTADYGRIVLFTLGLAYVGFFFATPFRRLFIIQLSRALNLVFPTATATATTIQSIHIAAAGETAAMKKVKMLGIAFVAALVLRVASNFAPGILWDWHVFTWFFIWGGHNNSAIFVENWGWFLEWTPAIIGSGMMVGTNTAASMFAGAVISWGIIGPVLVRTGVASGVKIMGPDYTGPWEEFTTYMSMNLEDPVNKPSPRYWLLWPGVLLMVAVSIVEVLCQYRLLCIAAKVLAHRVCASICSACRAVGIKATWVERCSESYDDRSDDTTDESQAIKPWMWISGLVLSIIVTCLSCGLQWGMPLSMTIVSIIMAVILTVLAILSTGMTDMTPLTAIAKSSQLVLGGMTRGDSWTLAKAQTLNSLGGAVAAGVANQATDLTADFRVGFLLRTPPRAQWIAQLLGSGVAIFLAPAIFLVFASAYPCILDITAETCAFSAPSVSAWRAATIAATSPTLPIPKSSGIFAICITVVGCLVTIVKHFYLVKERQKYRLYLPNFMTLGLMMVIPQPCIGTAMMIGAIIALLWKRLRPASYEEYLFSVLSGMIAGEGIGGVINAIVAIAGVQAGTGIGCPAGMC
ncbi:hypothetical protein NCS57_00930800 [Fusarium keratoplasticum]|uniref:Uncharacterized protein n=1 Tax=Fusarium keratoplasticum TaxID=1328300 RepID=A0ACC0QS17_9HYPO|nr:hypothetical protein NCS57_00930800 [Fusarium keratoplasticum]KAI8663302.1 hypothetical protein NCS57_00930800 [Fusarium keratoplasticum]